MKILVAEKFSGKVKSLNNETILKLQTTIGKIGTAKNQLELYRFFPSMYFLDGNIGVIRIAPDYRLFYSIETKIGKENESIVVLLDITRRTDEGVFGHSHPNESNPTYPESLDNNPQKNPYTNDRLNPKSNATINPLSNPVLNYRSNPVINPNSNPLINPSSNPLINPISNPLINPKTNPALSPKNNPHINPKTSPDFDGYFVFDLALNRNGYIIKANEEVVLFFDGDDNVVRFGVKAQNNIFVVYLTQDNLWTANMIPDGDLGFNIFDLENEWIMIVK